MTKDKIKSLVAHGFDDLPVHESSYFNFTPELFERVIVGWELIEVKEEIE